jgi:hypothetical protein
LAAGKKQIRFRITIATLLFISFVTGGILFVDIRDFGPAVPVKLAEGSTADIWLQPEIWEVGSPLLVIYKRYTSPYTLNIRNWDGGGAYKTISILDVIVTYADGKVAHPKLDVTEVHPRNVPGIKTARILTAILDVVDRCLNNKIAVKGMLEKNSGEKVPFDISLNFETRHKMGLAPYWIALATSK